MFKGPLNLFEFYALLQFINLKSELYKMSALTIRKK